MKRLLIAVTLSGMLSPTLALADLNYNSVGIDYSKSSNGDASDLSGIDLNISKNIYSNVFLAGSILNGRQSSGSSLGDLSVYEFVEGVGYHAPIKYNVDFIVSGKLRQSRSTLAGTMTNENGYDLGVGVRAELAPKFEGEVSANYSSVSTGSLTTTGNEVDFILGYLLTSEFKLLINIGSESITPPIGSSYNSRKLRLGTRFYF